MPKQCEGVALPRWDLGTGWMERGLECSAEHLANGKWGGGRRWSAVPSQLVTLLSVVE